MKQSGPAVKQSLFRSVKSSLKAVQKSDSKISQEMVEAGHLTQGATMNERRRYLRVATTAEVEISHPSFGSMKLMARDMSEGGMCVVYGHQTPPPVGTELQVVVKRHTGLGMEPVTMRVVHIQPDGTMGLQYKTS